MWYVGGIWPYAAPACRYVPAIIRVMAPAWMQGRGAHHQIGTARIRMGDIQRCMLQRRVIELSCYEGGGPEPSTPEHRYILTAGHIKAPIGGDGRGVRRGRHNVSTSVPRVQGRSVVIRLLATTGNGGWAGSGWGRLITPGRRGERRALGRTAIPMISSSPQRTLRRGGKTLER